MQARAQGGAGAPSKPADDDEPRFSDGEDVPEDHGGLRAAAEGTRDSLDAGDDCSGAVSADISQPTCVLCGQFFDVAWDAGRDEIVARDAVMLQNVLYHTACIRHRRGPNR